MRKLEERFGNSIAIVGVHSGKYTAERDTANIRDAAIRLRASHPTINDRQFRIWRAYAVQAWPTLVAIDPRGYVVGNQAGEFDADAISSFLARVIETARTNGTLDEKALLFPEDPPTNATGTLAYPGKIAIDHERVGIADSGHHRVLVGRLLGDTGTIVLERAVGTGPAGRAGFADGADARFDNPQGIVFSGDELFVADAGNHSVRAISLFGGTTRTVAGNGKQIRTSSDLRAGSLSSPWDLAIHENMLFVAMAGRHQIWSMPLSGGRMMPLSGSGAEAIVDGPHAQAALAQPMGIAADGNSLVFADSESSAIRIADANTTGSVRTVIGTGLFDFGDLDGVGDAVRIQHPQSVVVIPDGRYLVADSYNGALKWVDPKTREVTTFVKGLAEPSGLAVSGGMVYVAETNAHRIVTFDLATGSRRIVAIDNSALELKPASE